MNKEKKKLDPVIKTKLILQGEYLFISIVFLVLGILKLLDIYKTNDIRAHIFNIVTLLGGLWGLVDFFWSTFSKKRREKVTYLDKVLAFPLSIFLVTYNLISIIIWNNVNDWYRYGMGFVFIYAFLMLSFEAVYHWFYPTKALLEVLKEEEEETKKLTESEAKIEEKENGDKQ